MDSPRSMPSTPQPRSPTMRRGAATFQQQQQPHTQSGLFLDESSSMSPRQQQQQQQQQQHAGGACVPSRGTNNEDGFGGLLGSAALPFRRYNGDFGALAQIMNVGSSRGGKKQPRDGLTDDTDDASGLLSLSGQTPHHHHQQQQGVFRAPLLGHVRAAARSNLEPAFDSQSTSLALGDAGLPAAVLSTSAIGPNGAPLTVYQVSTLRVRHACVSSFSTPEVAADSATVVRDDDTDENGRRNTGPYIPTDLGVSDNDALTAAVAA